MKRLTSPDAIVKIRDVAQKVGVSVATASYALNNTGRVSVEVRERVLKAAEEMGYTPSLAAQALKGTKGNLIGILTDGFAGPWYGEILEGLQPTLKDAGYAVVALTIQKETLNLCKSLVNSGLLRGLAVLNPSPQWQPQIEALIKGIPTAVFDPDVQYAGAVRFVLDNGGAIRTLMDHLWDKGYRDYLWLDGLVESAWDAQERLSAFEAYFAGKPGAMGTRRRAFGGFRVEISYSAVKKELETGNKPRVIVAANDESAIGALKAVREKGLRVPEDIAISGFDGLDASAWTSPALTTLRYDRRSLGAAMAQSLLDSLSTGRIQADLITLPLELIVRQST